MPALIWKLALDGNELQKLHDVKAVKGAQIASIYVQPCPVSKVA